MATHVISGAIGVDLTKVTTSAEFLPGTKVDLSDGGSAVYCQAASEISQYAAVSMFQDNTVQMLTTTTAGTTKRVGFSDAVSVASGSYAWIRTSGRPVVNLAANCADQVILFTTATSGVLDDATVSACLVAGVTSTVTISNATAITCIVPDGAYVHPFVNPA